MNARKDPRRKDDCSKTPAPDTAHTIGDVLEELLAQYRARFPELRLTVVETSEALA